MSQWLYVSGSDDDAWDRGGNWRAMARTMLTSVRRHCRGPRLLCQWHGKADVVEFVKGLWPDGAIVRILDDQAWAKGWSRVWLNGWFDPALATGDEVIFIDLDTIVQDNPFQLFRDDFDIGWCNRPEPNELAPLGLGFLAARINPAALRVFYRAFNEVVNPKWPEYLRLFGTRKNDPEAYRQLLSAQDYFCTLCRVGWPCWLKTKNFGPWWNWYRAEDKQDPEKVFAAVVGDPRYKVVHFRGRDKKYMPAAARKIGLP